MLLPVPLQLQQQVTKEIPEKDTTIKKVLATQLADGAPSDYQTHNYKEGDPDATILVLKK